MADEAAILKLTWLYVRKVVLAFLHCWPIMLVPAVLAALATGTEQGRDAIAATATRLAEIGPGWHAYAAQTFSIVLTTLGALLLLGPPHGRRSADNFAAYFVPALIGLLTGYLPFMALDWVGFGNLGSNVWLDLARAVPPILVLAARDGLPLTAHALIRPLQRPLWLFDPVHYSIYIVAIAGLCVAAFFISSATTLALLSIVVFMIGDAVLYPEARLAIARWQRWLLIGCACYAVGGGLLVAFDPVGWGLGIGSYATLMVALNTWLGIGILIWQSRLIGASLSTIFVIILAALILSGPFGLGEIRIVAEPRVATADADMESYARAWLKDRQSEIDQLRPSERYPVFLITADGGGVRTAWWSATLLGLVADKAPNFSKHIFAMSGASGGSLGIATFASQLVEETGRKGWCMGEQRHRCAAELLSADLLAPTLAAMLTVDLSRSLVGNSIWPDRLRISISDDRATALERTLEHVWLENTGTRLFEEPFTRMWDGKRRLAVPLLLLNTSDAIGRRLVIAPLVTGKSTLERGDLLPLLGSNDIRLSTAVVLSARFPGITPMGWIKAGDAQRGYAVADGGYADNSGARSASEALAALHKAAKTEDLLDRIRVVAIMIANEPKVAAPDEPIPGYRSGVSTMGSLIAPVMTLDRLRQSNSEEAKRTFAKEVASGGGLVLHFDLKAAETAFPLGWMLASATRAAMDEQQRQILSDSSSHLCQAIRLVSKRGHEAASCSVAK